jgi:chromate transporter
MFPLSKIFLEFFRLGLIAFGGPAAHAALMEKELVGRRKWITHQQFLDYLGGVNLIPGPNSTQITMLVGYQLRGFWGMIMGGLGFVIPAAAITGALAVFYVKFQELPQLESILFGIKPAILAIIASAVLKLGKKAVKGFELGALGLIVVLITLLGVNEITAILGAGFAGMIYFAIKRRVGQGMNSFFPFIILNVASNAISQYSALKLFWIFMKIGALLFGSGYVLIAYVNAELVEKLGWITPEQLLDAIAIGQFTPGPLISSATFIGYLLDGYKGAMIATAGIVLPSFLFILLLYPFIGKLRKSPLTAAFLDSVNVAAVGVMVSVSIVLAKDVLIGWQSIAILVLSVFLVMGPWKLNSLWVVLIGGLSGIILSLV